MISKCYDIQAMTKLLVDIEQVKKFLINMYCSNTGFVYNDIDRGLVLQLLLHHELVFFFFGGGGNIIVY